MIDLHGKRLGILVGGGPAPGINGVISAVTIEARNRGMEVIGFRDGFQWLVEKDIDWRQELATAMQRSGTAEATSPSSGETFATVGLSQLTTSRQHVSPTFVARQAGENFILNGSIPWVTGAAKADHLVIGAVLEDGGQILAVLPRGLAGVGINPPLDLMALEGSITAEVRCDHVVLDKRWLLAGPAERVMMAGRSGTGGLETSCLALGLAGAAIDYLVSEAKARTELQVSGEHLEQSRRSLRQEMHKLAAGGCTAEVAASLRARANSLVLRATQAALTASKIQRRRFCSCNC